MKNTKKKLLLSFSLVIFMVAHPSPDNTTNHQELLTRFYTYNKLPLKTNKHPEPKPKPALAELTILILIQASNNLESFAYSNMKEMMKWGSTNEVNILVDLHKTGDKSWKYKIEQGFCSIEEVLARNEESSIEKEVFESAQWAVTEYPAKKYAIIFWNHGLGCIDPQINNKKPGYLAGYDNTWRTADWTTTEDSRASRNRIPSDRGILFDDERQTYLSNQGLRNTLKRISTELLNNQKLALIGMDACLMGMLEIADQIKEYADYFISSEEFEFAQGWPYGDIVEKVTLNPTLSSKEIGTFIVHAYERYWSSKTSYYTQSCMDLSKIEALKQNINALALFFINKKAEDPARIKLFIQQAKSQALAFSLSDYIDLQSLYQELLKLTNYAIEQPLNKAIPTPQLSKESYIELKTILLHGLALIKETVVANTTGRYLSRAGGISIYFPQKSLDSSYINTETAQTTSWASFIIDQTLPR